MADFEQGDIIRVPFPYTDKDTRQRRPALVVSSGPIGEASALLWVVMITSAENRPWLGDVPIPSHERSGLPVASVVRPFKIATIEVRHADRIGKIAKPALRNVMHQLQTILSVNSSAD
ncbi:mRNA interferase MazF [Tardiphaga sp. OK246]|jgi:mRNA interferase MazF|uniref:type II toxin-antitoxin system PemK/MazF family toxin n=1 Tax=Tardiphaga sp. OK246 TaxID=1855307 RepID=UPI000B7694E4|nr:type II toxin-antitoxin system PemK/MazF family toxin [Tardiphaga sp. OK246]SNT58828.1 mRNA interferase MazF [Tardiphaga sp. OK246]